MFALTKKLPVALLLILCISLMGPLVAVRANFHEPPPTMQIVSPTNGSTISQTDVLLNVTVVLYRYSPSFVFETMSWVNYSLDNEPAVNLTVVRGPDAGGPGHYEIATCMLSGLSEGSHHVRVMGESIFNAIFNETSFDQTIYFYVNLNPPKPTVTALLSVNARFNTLIVPDDYSTIQAAIDHATAGDTVFVKNGIYSETLFINKSISLIGQDRNLTVLDAQKSHVPAITIQGDNITVANFTLGNTGFGPPTHKYWTPVPGEGAGIRVTSVSNYVTITSNTIVDCPYEGIVLDFSKYNLVTDNLVFGSIYGVEVQCVLSTIENNTFAVTNNTSTIHQEVYIPYASIITGETPEGKKWDINESNTIKANQLINVTSVPTPFPSPTPSPSPASTPTLTGLLHIAIISLVIIIVVLVVVLMLKKRAPKNFGSLKKFN